MVPLRTLPVVSCANQHQRSGTAQAHMECLRPCRAISGAPADNLRWATEDHNPMPTDHYWSEIVIAVVMAVIEIVKVVRIVEW